MTINSAFSDNVFKVWFIQIQKILGLLSSSFWFVPTVLISLAMGSALYILPYLNTHITTPDFLAHGGLSKPDTSIQLVQVVASSIITVTSIAFSMTLVVLVMASNSFGPRLIRRFMQNKKTQFVLGFLTASFVYCVLILSQMNLDAKPPTHPILSIFVALVLAIACVFVLIFFIHHVAVSIRADEVVKEISNSLLNDMKRLQSRYNSQGFSNEGLCTVEQYLYENNSYQKIIRSQKTGYVQAIEYEKITEIAARYDGVVKIEICAGSYIYPDSQIACIYSDIVINTELSLDESIVTGSERTSLQDPQFAINQLVEVALRALSPSMNDPFTAKVCIDKLGAAMASFSQKTLPKIMVLDENKTARVLTNESSFDDLFAGAFTQIRQSSANQTAVVCHLLDTFNNILMAKQNAKHLAKPIKDQISAIQQTQLKGHCLTNDLDNDAVENRIVKILKYLALD